MANKNYESMKLDQNNYKNISNSLFYSSMFYLFIFCFFFSINCCCGCNNSSNINEEFKITKIGSEHFDDLILGDNQKDRKNYFLIIFNIFFIILIIYKI